MACPSKRCNTFENLYGIGHAVREPHQYRYSGRSPVYQVGRRPTRIANPLTLPICGFFDRFARGRRMFANRRPSNTRQFYYINTLGCTGRFQVRSADEARNERHVSSGCRRPSVLLQTTPHATRLNGPPCRGAPRGVWASAPDEAHPRPLVQLINTSASTISSEKSTGGGRKYCYRH